MSQIPEQVILVDNKNHPIGTALKAEVHTNNTPLHRAFSLFIFNAKGELLLQQRAHTKKTWPLVWSNSCCGHPVPGESTEAAVKRRAQQELGLDLEDIHTILPDYRYRAELHGVVENEICPVFVAFTDQSPHPNPEEIAAIKWVTWADFQQETNGHNPPYSPWCIEETKLIGSSTAFKQLVSTHVSSNH